MHSSDLLAFLWGTRSAIFLISIMKSARGFEPTINDIIAGIVSKETGSALVGN